MTTNSSIKPFGKCLKKKRFFIYTRFFIYSQQFTSRFEMSKRLNVLITSTSDLTKPICRAIVSVSSCRARASCILIAASRAFSLTTSAASSRLPCSATASARCDAVLCFFYQSLTPTTNVRHSVLNLSVQARAWR